MLGKLSLAAVCLAAIILAVKCEDGENTDLGVAKRRGWGKRSPSDSSSEANGASPHDALQDSPDKRRGWGKRGWGKRYFDLEEMTKKSGASSPYQQQANIAHRDVMQAFNRLVSGMPASQSEQQQQGIWSQMSKRRGWGKRSSYKLSSCDRMTKMMLYHINRAVQFEQLRKTICNS